MKEDYYDILGISKGASDADIKSDFTKYYQLYSKTNNYNIPDKTCSDPNKFNDYNNNISTVNYIDL